MLGARMPAPTTSHARGDEMGLIAVEADVLGRSAHAMQVSGRVGVGATARLTKGRGQRMAASVVARLLGSARFVFASRL